MPSIEETYFDKSTVIAIYVFIIYKILILLSKHYNPTSLKRIPFLITGYPPILFYLA